MESYLFDAVNQIKDYSSLDQSKNTTQSGENVYEINRGL